MQISVSGKNMDTGAAFQTHAEDALNGVVNKYFDRAVSGHVTLEKADAGFRVKTRVALSRRIELEATGYAHNAHAALDAAIEGNNNEIKKRHVPGLRVGKIGLEKTFENKLIGSNGIQRYEVNAYGKRINQIDYIEGKKGEIRREDCKDKCTKNWSKDNWENISKVLKCCKEECENIKPKNV